MSKEIATLFVFASESTPGKSYQTLVYIDGSMSCDCPGWKFKKKTTADGERTCRHLRDIESGLANQHAIKTVEYATAAPRVRQRAMAQPMLRPATVSRTRAINLEEDP